MTAIWQFSASEAAGRIASGDLSAREVVGAAVERMAATNPHINAVVDDLGDSAMARAAALDADFAKSGPVGPLHGVPITIKENIDQKGRATPNGVKAFAGLIAPDDSPFVSNMLNAGAVIIGRTNTPEFSFRATTDNDLHGRTFNPWNDWASAGGSSGGASAAVMSGMCAVAHGNDIGGSLRFPSTCTGAVTVKPGLGRVPAYNPSQTEERGMLAQLMSVQGVICREVRDVRLAMQAAIAPSPLDPWHVPLPWAGPELPRRVGVTRETYGYDMDPAVARALDAAEAALCDAGYEVVAVTTPDVAQIGEDAVRSLFGEVQVLLRQTMRTHGSATFNAYFDRCFAVAPPYEGDDLIRAMARRAGYIRDWQVLLADTPLVLTPYMLRQTYAHDADLKGPEGAAMINRDSFYSFAMNFMGLPAGNVPALENDGLPVGVQIVGQRFREDLILDALEAIEARVGVMAHRLFAREA